MISGKNNIICTLYICMCLSNKNKFKIPSFTDNLHRGLKYLTNLPLKIRVDIQYLYT